MAVLRVFDAEHPHLTLSEVSRSAELTRATARRILHTFVDLGYMSTDGKRFGLRPKTLEIGYSYLSSMGLPAIAQPHLEKLTERAMESSSVAVMDGSDIIYVARVAKRSIMTVAINVGTRFPAYATSLGRVLLANLEPAELDAYLQATTIRQFTPHTKTDKKSLMHEFERVREQGWALVDQELEEGLRSIAAPLHDRSGKVVASVNVSASSQRGSADEVVEQLLPDLLRATQAIDSDLRSATLRL